MNLSNLKVWKLFCIIQELDCFVIWSLATHNWCLVKPILVLSKTFNPPNNMQTLVVHPTQKIDTTFKNDLTISSTLPYPVTTANDQRLFQDRCWVLIRRPMTFSAQIT